jgi:hypothetical protein
MKKKFIKLVRRFIKHPNQRNWILVQRMAAKIS